MRPAALSSPSPAPPVGARERTAALGLAHARQAAAVRLGLALARADRAAVPGRRQVRQHRRAAGPEETGRRAGAQARRPARRAGRSGRDPARLRRAARLDHALHRAARVPVLSGRGADRPARLARGVRAPARAEPALSPRAPDRRRLARHRARLALDPVAAELHDLQHPADAGRDHARHRPALGQVRRLVRGDHLRRARLLHRLHGDRHRVAHRVPSRHERAGLEGQHQGARRAPQLRDGQVLLQRGLRAGALRRQPAAAREGVDQVADVAVDAQPRPEPDHRHRGDAARLARDRRRRRRVDDARRPGARQRADDPALHPAQLPRRHLPRDQAVADRPGEDVRAARPEPRDRRRAGRATAADARRRGALRRRPLRLRRRPRDPARRQLRDPGRQDGRRRRALGLGQEHAGAPDVPLLRRRLGPDRDRRPGHPRA